MGTIQRLAYSPGIHHTDTPRGTTDNPTSRLPWYHGLIIFFLLPSTNKHTTQERLRVNTSEIDTSTGKVKISMECSVNEFQSQCFFAFSALNNNRWLERYWMIWEEVPGTDYPQTFHMPDVKESKWTTGFWKTPKDLSSYTSARRLSPFLPAARVGEKDTWCTES